MPTENTTPPSTTNPTKKIAYFEVTPSGRADILYAVLDNGETYCLNIYKWRHPKTFGIETWERLPNIPLTESNQ